MAEHDFTDSRARWGWHIEAWRSDSSKDPAVVPTGFTGHGYGLKRDDIFLVEMRSGKVGRWRITSLRYVADPPDMFWADAVLVGYVEEKVG